MLILSMDWLKGFLLAGNHRFSYEIWGFPVDFPLNQSIEQCQDHQRSMGPNGTQWVSEFWDPVRPSSMIGLTIQEPCASGAWSKTL